MSSRRRGNPPKLELKLKLNLSPTKSSSQDLDAAKSTSPNSSCASTDPDQGTRPAASNMVLVGCPRCLMFVMLLEANPRCPQCKSTMLLDFVSGDVLSHNATKKSGQ